MAKVKYIKLSDAVELMRKEQAECAAADLCVFLPDWEESRGARLERAYCEYIGKRTETWKG